MLHAAWEVKTRLSPAGMGRLAGFGEISCEISWYFDNLTSVTKSHEISRKTNPKQTLEKLNKKFDLANFYGRAGYGKQIFF